MDSTGKRDSLYVVHWKGKDRGSEESQDGMSSKILYLISVSYETWGDKVIR
jgi:hypothetical protein